MAPGQSLENFFRGHQLARLAAWGGILGPLVILLGMIISAWFYSGTSSQPYNPLNHFVSELGELGASPAAPIFNAGLVLGGMMNTAFLAYLPFQVRGWARYPLLLLGPTASLSGMLVGFFPVNYLDQHIFVALAFFNLGLLVAFFYSVLFLFSKNQPFPKWLAVPGLINTAAFFAFNNFPSGLDRGVDFQEGMAGLAANRPDFIPLALLEWAVILGILIWFILIGLYLALASSREQSGRQSA